MSRYAYRLVDHPELQYCLCFDSHGAVVLSRFSYAAYSNIQDCRVVSKEGEEERSNCLLYLSVSMAVPSIRLSRAVMLSLYVSIAIPPIRPSRLQCCLSKS